jgi:hypothetical protein
MKILKQEFNSESIAIYKVEDDKLTGSFFDEKPKVGDQIIQHYPSREFIIKKILFNGDAITSPDFKKSSKNAHFVLKVSLLLPQGC